MIAEQTTLLTVTLPDGSQRTYDDPDVTGLTIARSISEGLARNVLAAEVNGQVQDATYPIVPNPNGTPVSVRLLTWADDEGKRAFWHTSAHLLAYALEELYPGIKLGTGPAIENGFYYDVDFGSHDGSSPRFSEPDFARVEAKMKELARQKFPNLRADVPKAEAIQFFTEKADPYKLELIDGLADGTITFYRTSNFTDLCAGPHIPDTSPIKAIKLMSVAGAYWRANEDNKQLTRVYGISFPKQADLDTYLLALEAAKQRDHRKLGRELELFYFDEMVGAGLPLWAPRGAMVRDAIGRKWQIGTIQVDYMMPENFNLTYVGADSEKHRPVMIHRALFGSMERFIALLIESTGGNFPAWLAPEPVVILPISDRFTDYARTALHQLLDHDIVARLDERDEKVGRKIREAELMKIPFMLVVGEHEVQTNTVAVRRHGGAELGPIPLADFVHLLTNEMRIDLSPIYG